MKKITLLLVLLASSLALRAMDASISFATFRSAEYAYVEVYLYLVGRTATFKPVQDSLQQATVEVLIVFKQQDNIVKFDKYTLHSPLTINPIDFLDLKRYALPKGTYELSVQLQDAHQPNNIREYTATVTLHFPEEQLQQSDIQLLAAFAKTDVNNPFVKNGFLLEPLPQHFYAKNASMLSFYNELYDVDKWLTEDFVVSYAIQKQENGTLQTVAIGHKRLSPQRVIPLLIQMDISQLQSGNYSLSVEVRNRAKEVLSQKTVAFQRSNPYLQRYEPLDLANVDLSKEFVSRLSAEELQFNLRALTPKLPPNDVALVDAYLKTKNLEAQRMYLFSFWSQQHPNQPEAAFLRYNEVARAVDTKFHSGFRYGFETDRGYIFLKYGAPDDIDFREDEPSAPPYEIWSYNEFPATKQNNVRFIFYNPSLAPGDFQLLHTDVIGELNNPQWELQLYRSAPNEVNGSPFDSTNMNDNFHRSARRIFRDN